MAVHSGQPSATRPELGPRRLLPFIAEIAERVLSATKDPPRQRYLIPLALASYALIWTLYGVIAKSTQDIHPDTAELLAWSNDLALGYWKHPPFGVYVVKLWTLIFPAEDWSFYLLAMVNSALALWISWILSARFLKGEKRVIGLALLTLVPFYNFFALNYNHNTLLMPLWAATTLFFLKSYEKNHFGFAALAGLTAGLATLGKYWTVFLLAGLVLGALTDPRRRAYFSSAAPWITVLVGSLTIAPHLAWLYHSNFTPFSHAIVAHADPSFVSAGLAALQYLLACALYIAIPLAIIAAVAHAPKRAILDTLLPSTLDRRLAAVVFWTPLLLPVPVAIFARIDLISLWLIPAMALLPTVLLGSPSLTIGIDARKWPIMLAMIVPPLAIICAPFVAWNVFLHPNDNGSAYYRELSAKARKAWRQEIDRPMKLLVGDRLLADGIAFYSPDPSIVNPDAATLRRMLASNGALAICRGSRQQCEWMAHEPAFLAAPPGRFEEVTLSRRFLGWIGKPATFSILVVPPVS